MSCARLHARHARQLDSSSAKSLFQCTRGRAADGDGNRSTPTQLLPLTARSLAMLNFPYVLAAALIVSQPLHSSDAPSRRLHADGVDRTRMMVASAEDVKRERARLNAIFSACADGRSITKEDEAAIRAVGGMRSSRYGEITPRGFATLGAHLSLGDSDVFADLGSGIGRVCSQAVRDFRVQAACGVELSRTRHDTAVEKLEDLKDASLTDRIRLECADCADESLWAPSGVLHDTTVLWMCSELFSNDLMSRIAERIEGSSDVRSVATLRRFPGGLAGYRESSPPVRCEMSWTAALTNPAAFGMSPDEREGAMVYIYEKLAVE